MARERTAENTESTETTTLAPATTVAQDAPTVASDQPTVTTEASNTAAPTTTAATTSSPNANVRMVKLVKPLSAATAGNPLNLPEAPERPVGTQMARKDFIKHRWAVDRVGRGQITKDLNEMNTVENGGNGTKIPYQVVFAVIKKGTPGGPVAGDNTAAAQS